MTEAEKKLAIRQAGLAMKAFLTWAQSEQVVNDLSAMQSLKTMMTVFVQNFIDNGMEPELIKVATGKGHVCSPHEPEAEYANKGKKGWIGYKAQVAESVNSGIQKFHYSY